MSPLEKDALDGSGALEFLARVAAQAGEPAALSRQFKNCSRYQAVVHLLWASRLLPRCSGSIRCSIRSGMIRASKNSPSRKHRNNSANFSDKFGTQELRNSECENSR